MKQWTNEERYRTYQESDKKELQALHETIAASRWREDYHVQPVTGLMNDPNGFSYFNGKWQLFYQWFPFGPVHGMKHWYRVSSEDLVNWKNEGLALKPELLSENYGCYSGSALVQDDDLYLAYTGNSKDYELKRHPYQLLAKMDREGRITKLPKPIIYPQTGYTEHQRDPKLFEYKGRYYILLGAQNEEKKGVFLIFESNDVEYGWQLKGELKVRGYESFGYMIECPDIEKVGDKWLLLFSPQGLEAEGDRFQQKFNNVYFIGDLDLENLEFIPDGPFEELDCGFDFYAAQCANQNVFENAAVMCGWFSCADYTCPPTEEQGWAHLMSLPRILTIEDGKLMQRPAPDMKKLEGEVLFKAENGTITADKLHGLMPRTAIIHLENPSLQSTELSLYSKNGRRGFEISYDRNAQVLTVDRSALNHQINEEFGAVRRIALENGLSALDVYVDRSSVEIFVNNGEKVVSARVFPEADERILRMGGKDINLAIYSPLKSVEDNFII